MHIQKKQLLGFGGLALVAGITAVAYNLPTSATSAGGDVNVVVQVYNTNFETKIQSPLDGSETIENVITFKEIHSKANSVKYYLTHVGENGEPDVTYELTEHEVVGDLVSGVTEFNLDLNNYGGLGTYIFKSVITSSNDRTSEDAVRFKYIAIETPDDEVKNEDDEIDIEVCYTAGTKILTMDIYDKSGRLVATLNDYIVKNPETGGCETIRIKVDNLDLNTGDYDIVIKSYDDDDKTGDPTGVIIIHLGYTKPDSPNVPVTPDAPNVPDTGALLSSLNISKSDFLITGLIGFTAISVLALFVIKRTNKRK